jgi:hypothetical protein
MRRSICSAASASGSEDKTDECREEDQRGISIYPPSFERSGRRCSRQLLEVLKPVRELIGNPAAECIADDEHVDIRLACHGHTPNAVARRRCVDLIDQSADVVADERLQIGDCQSGNRGM